MKIKVPDQPFYIETEEVYVRVHGLSVCVASRHNDEYEENFEIADVEEAAKWKAIIDEHPELVPPKDEGDPSDSTTYRPEE